MKYLNKITTCLLGLALLGITSACSDPMDEITSMNLKRNLSPINVSLLLIDRTNVQLTWTPSETATSYTIEVYADDDLEFNASHLESTFEGITDAQIPYLIQNLQGETVYSFRIKAVTDGDASKDSKWSTAKTTTGTEQIMQKPEADDIQAKSVVLKWKAGQTATEIILTDANGNVITHPVTAAEIAAGEATVDGLTPETEYTAVLKNGSKTRGTQTFTTGIELAEGDILVEAGAVLADIINNADANSRLIVMPGEYYLNTDGTAPTKLSIAKNLKIKGLRPNDMPVIHGAFALLSGVSLDVEQCILDGTGTDATQAFDFIEDGSSDHLTVSNTEIKAFAKGLVYVNKTVEINTIAFNNCLIHDIECSGGDFIDCRQGFIADIKLTNSTIYNSSKKRDIFRLDGTGQSNSFAGTGKTINILVDHCTFHEVGSGSANYRFFYNRFADNKITFTNNIVSGFNNSRGFTNDGTTDSAPTLSGNYYFNTINLLSLADGNTQAIKWFDTAGTALTSNPFTSADEGNFTITDPVLKAVAPGDPRWIE